MSETIASLPIGQRCPTCDENALQLVTHYSEPEHHPIGDDSYVATPAKVTKHEVVPCGHLLSTYRWERVANGATRWTLVPL